MRICTVGHGNRSTDQLVDVLADAGVRRLVDVRRFPASRRHPDLAREALVADLPTVGIAYEWWGDPLGGRRRPSDDPSRHPAWRDPSFRAYADHTETPEFRQAIVDLQQQARGGPATAVMCAETLWWRCHRRLIADTLVLRGTDVIHLLAPGREERHHLNPAVRADDDGWPVWDVGVDRELPLAGPALSEAGASANGAAPGGHGRRP